jgi:hypothetical protein
VANENVESLSAIQAVVEGVQSVAPGLSLSKILSDVGEELAQQMQHGAHEAAAGLFNGSSYVMYPRGDHGGNDQTVEAPAVEAPVVEQAIQEQSRGMEM